MQQEPNTVHMRLYTPSGVPLNFVLSIRDGKLTDTLPDVAAMEAMIAASGYLVTAPGAKPGEDVETITQVMRRLQFNKKDNSTTPCIGFFHESKGLVFAYWQYYLNEPADIADFEAATGIKVDSIPMLEDAAFPKRDDHFKQKYLVTLPHPIQARFTKEPYTKEDGTEGMRPKTFEGFVGSSKPAPAQTPPPASKNAGQSGTGDKGTPVIVWSQDEQKAFWQHWNGEKQVAKGVILDVLGVKSLGEFKNSLERANVLMDMETRKASGQ